MKQTCLCTYLGVRCNHPDTFLHIPLSIRQRIYLYAGVITGTYTAYPNIGKLDKDQTPQENYDLTYYLTCVCRQIRHEVEAIILSQNTIVYMDEDVDDGLDYLSRINPDACSMLRNVYVHLHVQPSPYSYDREPETLKWKRIEWWELAVTNILSHASPKELRLHVICDTPDPEKRSAVLRPLYRFPGVLLELELRLQNNRKDQTLSDLARETALCVQGRDLHDSRVFRFFDLPAEVRRNIFEYTNLVTPHRKVHWCHEFGFRGDFVWCECDGSVCREEDIHHERKRAYCCACSRLTGDFCMIDNGAYSSRCKHGLSPLPLLLTCRAMYEEALDFFYASNRVVILPDFNPDHAVFASVVHTETDDQAEADLAPEYSYIKHDTTKLFVEAVGPKAIKHMRDLEIVFPRIGPNSGLSDTHPAYREWCRAVDYLVQGNARKLTLAVHIWTISNHSYEHPSIEKTAHLLDTHAAPLLKPLQALPQLERLFVHLEWPQHWSPPKLIRDIETSKLPKRDSPGCGIGLHFIPQFDKKLARKEVRLERIVMGAGYDSYSMGKGEELPSQWLRGGWDCSF